MSIVRQCEYFELGRSSFYYRSVRDETYNLELIRLIDEQYTKTPFFGVRRMTARLRREAHAVNLKRVRRLMHVMGLEAIYSKRYLSQSCAAHKKYPYLLGGLEVSRPDQVWFSGITYIGPTHP